MAKGKLLLGLDIGASSAKMCLLRESRGNYELEAVDREPFPTDSIVEGQILNRKGVVDALRHMVSRTKIKQKQCAIAISGNNSVFVRRIRTANMSDEELASNIPWEVQQHINYDYQKIYYDYVVIGRNPVQNSMDILIVACKREIVNDYMSVVKEAGLDVKVVDVVSFALQNMVETVYGASDENSCIGIVDIGASVTSISMMIGGVTQFTRDTLIGGDNITEEIQKQLSLTREEAERYKTGEMTENAIIPKEVAEITAQVSEMIANEVKKSFSFFYETSGRDRVDKMILCGGVFKNEASLRTMERIVNENIELADPFRGLKFNEKLYTRDSLASMALESSVALGLALRRNVE